MGVDRGVSMSNPIIRTVTDLTDLVEQAEINCSDGGTTLYFRDRRGKEHTLKIDVHHEYVIQLDDQDVDYSGEDGLLESEWVQNAKHRLKLEDE